MPKVGSQVRCEICRIHHLLCFCDETPKLNLATKVIVLMHKAESKLPSNTARLATRSLVHSELRVRGLENAPLDLSDVDEESFVLYPSDTAIELSENLVKTLSKPITLIVPDGSWSQAKSTMKREDVLKKLRKVKLPKGELSQYHLRSEPTEESVSTFEAIERALTIIHGKNDTEELRKVFKMMVERTLWAKSLLHENACTYPIPEKALYNRYHPPQKIVSALSS